MMSSPSAAPRAASAWPLVAAVVTLALVQALVLLRVATLPAPAPADAPATEFSAGRAGAVLARLSPDELPHPAGSAADAAVVERLEEELRALGVEPSVQETLAEAPGPRHRLAAVRNVVAVVPGREDGPAVMLSAHHDSVPAGPGAADDLSGVAIVVEAARALLAGPPPRHAVVLLVSDAEEAGLLGARAFAAEHPLAARVAAVVNLDARGTGGPSVLFRTRADARGDGWLLDAVAPRLPRPVTSSAIAVLVRYLPNDTDLTSFAAAGMPGVDFAFGDGVSRYHTPRDDRAHLDPRTLQHQGASALAAVRALADTALERPGSGEPAPSATWFDVLGAGVVRAGSTGPRAWLRPIFLLAACLVGGSLGRRRGWLRIADVAAGAGASVAGLLLAAGAGWLVVAGERLLTGSSVPWTAHPGLTSWAVGLVGAAAALAISALLGRRRDAGGLLAGVAGVMLLAAIVTGAAEPGLSYLFAEPGAAGAIGLLALALLRQRGHASGAAGAWAALPAAALAGAVLLELAYALHVMTGPAVPFVLTTPVALAAAWLAPAVGAAPRRLALALPAVLLLAGGAALGLAARAPSFTVDEPRHVTLTWRADLARGEAFWIVEREDGDPLPVALAAAAPFEMRTLAFAPVGEGRRLAAPAPLPPVAPPRLDVLADARTDAGGRRLELRLAPGREGFELAFWVSRAPGVVSLSVGDRALAVSPGTREGWEAFTVAAPPTGGLPVELVLADDDGVDVVLGERRAGLPAAAAPLLAARPHDAVPVHHGDSSLVVDRRRL